MNPPGAGPPVAVEPSLDTTVLRRLDIRHLDCQQVFIEHGSGASYMQHKGHLAQMGVPPEAVIVPAVGSMVVGNRSDRYNRFEERGCAQCHPLQRHSSAAE
jgi:hypothetical protein